MTNIEQQTLLMICSTRDCFCYEYSDEVRKIIQYYTNYYSKKYKNKKIKINDPMSSFHDCVYKIDAIFRSYDHRTYIIVHDESNKVRNFYYNKVIFLEN